MTSVPQPRYDAEEVARRGDEIYERAVLPHLEPEDQGKLVLIDIETESWEIDWDEIAASDRLLARIPDAQVWMRLVGARHARRIAQRSKIGSVVEASWGTLRSDTRQVRDILLEEHGLFDR
jgi:hypothetical protein